MADNDPDTIIENVKGSAKEIAGKVTDDENLEKEGQAQQEKARQTEEADAKEAEAAKLRKKAQGHKGEQKARDN